MLVATVALAAAGALAAEEQTRDRDSTDDAARSWTEEVRVRATRLPDRPDPEDDIPAHVTVLDLDRIERSPAATVQELLETEPGVLLVDNTGNGVQRTLDLRGFAGGRGTTVYLDGVRLNDPRNDRVALDLVPLQALDRIVVLRGSGAALAGGGSQAGSLHLTMRRGQETGGRVEAAAGTHDAARVRAAAGFGRGRFDLFVSATTDGTDGFRENAAADRRNATVTGGIDLGRGRRIGGTFVAAETEAGTPGALTEAEWSADPDSAPFNRSDFLDDRSQLAAAHFRGPVSRAWSLATNLSRRTVDRESLVTGRVAPVFGGSFLESETAATEAVVQATRQAAGNAHRIVAGLEWSDGAVDARTFATPPESPGSVDRTSPSSDNRVNRETVALFVQDTWSPVARWAVVLGARHDRNRVGYADRLAGTAGDSVRDEDTTLRAGVTWSPTDATHLRVSYSEAFLSPTAEQLFAFPGFGSNPDLRPESSETIEIGTTVRGNGAARLDAAVFRIDTSDEILFDPMPDPDNPFGRNVNAGRTRRLGAEVSARIRIAGGWHAFGNVTWLDAEFRDDTLGRSGKRVPLVPGRTLSAGIDGDVSGRARLRVEALHVGGRPLEGDERNERPELPAHTVVNARISWRAGTWEDADDGGVSLFVEARNLLDETYATRGILAFDFSTSLTEAFFVPAPDRSILTGVAFDF